MDPEQQARDVAELNEMTPEQKAATAALLEPVPMRTSSEAPQLVIEGSVPDTMCPPVEPYLRDVPVARNPMTGEIITERRFTLDTAKQYLLDCPKVPVIVPPDTLDELSKPHLPWRIPCTWKGVTVWVPKCRQAMVPAPIAEMLGHKAEPLRTTQAKRQAPYVTEVIEGPNSRGMVGPEIIVQ
jgi:hypothetical protein